VTPRANENCQKRNGGKLCFKHVCLKGRLAIPAVSARQNLKIPPQATPRSRPAFCRFFVLNDEELQGRTFSKCNEFMKRRVPPDGRKNHANHMVAFRCPVHRQSAPHGLGRYPLLISRGSRSPVHPTNGAPRGYAYMAFWSRRGVYRTMFLSAWSSGERKRSMPLDDRQITRVLLSASRDLAGAKRVAETAAGIPLKWEAGGAFRSVNAVGRAQVSRDGQYGWYLIIRSK
jgi:hypothetical protein